MRVLVDDDDGGGPHGNGTPASDLDQVSIGDGETLGDIEGAKDLRNEVACVRRGGGGRSRVSEEWLVLPNPTSGKSPF